MPIVTDIKTQVKNQDKVSVFIDGKYTFALTLAQLAESKLVRVSKELSEPEVKELKKLSKLTNQYIRMVGLIYMRPRSEYEVRTKLKLKKIESDQIEELISKLTSEGYLNDEKFTEWWVNSRKSSRPTSALKLKSELAQKGVKSELIEQFITQNFTKEDELNSLQKLIEKKKDKYDTEQKLMAYLASKGFNYSQIKEVLSSSNNNSF